MNVNGLSSGLDTSTIISQLMQLEARSQTMLKSRVSTTEKAITALQGLNTKLAAITTKAGALATEGSAWRPTSGASTSDKFTVTTSAGAAASTLSLTVDRLATAHAIDFGLHALTDAVTTDGSTKVYLDKLDGTGLVEIETGDGTVKGLAAAINASDKGLSAALVNVDGTNYRLKVTSTATGTSSDFALQDGSGNQLAMVGTVTTGQNAQITVGADQITSESNTFKGLMQGVDVDISRAAVGDTTQVTVTRDVASMKTSVKELVDALNGLLGEISTATSYDATTKKAGTLQGDATVRDVRNKLLTLVGEGVGGKSLASVGIELDRYGKITFDEKKFEAAYTSDAAGTTALLAGTATADGFTDKLKTLGTQLSDKYTGTLTQAVTSQQTLVKGWQDDIADWDIRLASRRTTLERQFAALETSMSRLQSQGNWLAGQIAGLPKYE
ncbi:flagellar filament capping protein FliD [Nocardioides pakistanensis]